MDNLNDFEVAVVYILGSAISTALVIFAFWAVARRAPNTLMRLNFRGSRVPVIGGYPLLLLPLIPACLAYWALRHVSDIEGLVYATLTFAAGTSGFAAVGLIDDLWGDRSAGGFRGHFHKLIEERRVTTGLIKVLAGGLIALFAALLYLQISLNNPPIYLSDLLRFFPHRLYPVVALYGVFIALSANTLNLFDLRPGRCVTVAMILCIAAILLSGGDLLPELLLGALLVLLPLDRSGKLMLGDAGANALGAGIAISYLDVLSVWQVAVAIVVLIAFQLWCEKHSLSRYIESKPLLRALDRKIGVR